MKLKNATLVKFVVRDEKLEFTELVFNLNLCRRKIPDSANHAQAQEKARLKIHGRVCLQDLQPSVHNKTSYASTC